MKNDSPSSSGVNTSMRPGAGIGLKRPHETTLPCQEIQYLDISYQKVIFKINICFLHESQRL